MTAAHSRHRQRTAMNEDDDESPAKCRERRHRRIEMRRMAMAGPSSLSASPASTAENPSATDASDRKRIRTEGTGDPTSSSSGDDVEALAGPSSAGRFPVPVQVPAAEVAPVFGTMSVAGRSRDMEDAILVRTNLCRPDFNRRLPVHFFAVYDGHGGAHVAGLCRDKMHFIMEEELMLVGRTGFGSGCSSSSSREAAVERWVKAAMKRCFARMDEVALKTCACGSMGYDCECHPMEMALSGSTAVVAILTANNIFVANCGDSRAVLCRGGRAVPLSYDHKPDRPDEYARIQACGGRVIFLNGARVEGILAMSRALGDKYLKPIVISEPEISITDRDPEDECLILASDGLWDVLSNDLACEIASECLREGSPPAAPRMQEDEGAAPAFYPSRSASAAALLTRLALGRRSADNISVIVVDLKRN